MQRLCAATSIDLTVAGERLEGGRLRALSQVRVQQRLQAPALCELTFEMDASGEVDVPLAVGDAFSIVVQGSDRELFSGEATAVEHRYRRGSHEIRVRGYDLLHRLRKRQPLRAHVAISLESLARHLVADLGLEIIAPSPGPTFDRVLQAQQNDLELLEEIAERSGRYFVLDGTRLRLLDLDGQGEGMTLTLGANLLEATIEVNGDPACRSVSAHGWDPQRALARRGSADSARVGCTVSAHAPPALFGADGQVHLTGACVQDEHQADALAQGSLDRRIAQEVVLRGIAEGDPDLRPGAIVQVDGVQPEHQGRFVLTAVTHCLDARRGYLCELDSAPPAPRPHALSRMASLGTVLRIDDPEKLGRIQVALPACGGLESGWLEVLSVGAGTGKGLVALPDVDDRVLVLFPEGDPSRGVVLGGLYGGDGPPESGIEGGKVRRYSLRTPAGQRLTLDDQHQLVRFENRAGSFVELSDAHMLLHAHAVPLTLEAPGQTVTIRGGLIDFEKG